MLIRNARILTEKAGLLNGCLRIRDGIIQTLGGNLLPEDGEEVFEAEGRILAPGLVDVHNHGFKGTEFASPDRPFGPGLEALAEKGVTTVVPTLRSLPHERMLSCIENAVREIRKAEKREGPPAAKPAGIHLEGPFLSPDKCGSMIRNNLSLPDRDRLRSYLDAGQGFVRTVVFAPELEGALDLVEDILSAGANASIGHTNATYEQARAAADRGANLVTHLFNAMSPFRHREPGAAGEALTDGRLTCELICDFVHNHPSAVALAVGAKGPDRIVMVSDTGVMAGLGDGDYVVEGVRRIVRNGVCRTEDGTIAGSVCDLSVGFRNLLKSGWPLETVSRMASRNPARIIGIGDRTGTIETGNDADLQLLSPSFEPVAVWVGGRMVRL